MESFNHGTDSHPRNVEKCSISVEFVLMSNFLLNIVHTLFKVMRIMRQRFLWLDALPDANPPPLSRLGTGWGVSEGNSLIEYQERLLDGY